MGMGPALALVLAFALAGCSSGSTSSSTSSTSVSSSTSTSTASSAECADAAALESSLQALTSVNPLQDGQAAVLSAVNDVKAKLDAAVSSASATLKPQVEAVKTAFNQLEAAANGLTTDNYREKAPAIIAAVQQVGVATTALATALKRDCPGM
jgi:hypothetical protein